MQRIIIAGGTNVLEATIRRGRRPDQKFLPRALYCSGDSAYVVVATAR